MLVAANLLVPTVRLQAHAILEQYLVLAPHRALERTKQSLQSLVGDDLVLYGLDTLARFGVRLAKYERIFKVAKRRLHEHKFLGQCGLSALAECFDHHKVIG